MTLWDAYVLANRRRCSLRVRLTDGEDGQLVRVATRRADGQIVLRPEHQSAELVFVTAARAKEILVERAR